MKKKNLLVKMMFMNILTAGAFVFALVMTACADDFNNERSDKTPDGADARLLEAYGLMYTDFDTEDDVMILDADTTEIAVSKQLADKLGINSFVAHPMGIWLAIDQLPFARKAKEEHLVGDRYILKVERTTVAELIGDKSAKLSTSVYVNDKPLLQTRHGGLPDYGSKYVDESGVIHPAVIHLTDPYGYDEPYHVKNDQPLLTRSANDGHYQYYTAEELAGNTTRGLGASMHVNVLSLKSKITFDRDFHVSAVPGDTLNLSGQIPIDYSVNYFMTLEGGVKWDSWLPDVYVKKFETGLDGNYSFSPECYLSWKASAKLKKDLERLTLATFGQYTFTFVVGVVPVCVLVKPSLYIKFNAGVEGGARVGFKYEYANRFKAGIRYQNGWSSIQEFEELKNDFKLVKPEVFFAVNAGVGFYLGVDVMIYGVAGPEIGIGPNLGAKMNCSIRPMEDKAEDIVDFKASVDLRIQAFAGAKLSLLGYNLAKWSTDIDLAGPWNLFMYPSDGSEHKDPNKQKQEETNAFWNKVVQAMAGGSQTFIEEYENLVNQLINMNGIDREEAISIIANDVLNGRDIKTTNLNDRDTMATLMELYELCKSHYNAAFSKYAFNKCMKEMGEFVKSNEQFKTYSSYVAKWEQSLDFQMIGEEFQSRYNRLPEQTPADLQKILEMTLGSSYICYKHHGSNWSACYVYLMDHATAGSSWAPQNIKKRAAYDTMMIWHNVYHKDPASRDNWENMACDFNSYILDIYQCQRKGIDICDK